MKRIQLACSTIFLSWTLVSRALTKQQIVLFFCIFIAPDSNCVCVPVNRSINTCCHGHAKRKCDCHAHSNHSLFFSQPSDTHTHTHIQIFVVHADMLSGRPFLVWMCCQGNKDGRKVCSLKFLENPSVRLENGESSAKPSWMSASNKTHPPKGNGFYWFCHSIINIKMEPGHCK